MVEQLDASQIVINQSLSQGIDQEPFSMEKAVQQLGVPTNKVETYLTALRFGFRGEDAEERMVSYLKLKLELKNRLPG